MLKCILSLILFSSINSYSQFIVKDSLRWSGITCASVGGYGSSIYVWEIQGPDTLINGKTYRTVWSSSDSTFSNLQIAAFMRETPGGEVFILDTWNGAIEEPLYNFGLQIGDTFPSYFHLPYGELYVSDVTDSLIYGRTRRMITLTTSPIWSDTVLWVERVGSFVKDDFFGIPSLDTAFLYQGLIPQDIVDCGEGIGFCHWEYDSLIYSNPGYPSYDDCFPWSYSYFGGLIEKSETELLLFPQPANDKLSFMNLDSNRSHKLRIFNLMGKLIMTVNLPSSHNELIVSTLPTGVYFIQSEDGKVMERFVISR